MLKILLIIPFLAAQIGCNQKIESQPKANDSDTLVDLKNREMTVKYYKDSKDSVQLLKTTSKIINDSLSKLPEFKILRFSLKKYDELNFFNPNEIPQNLKYFKVSNDTLYCDVYFNSPPGEYYFGKLHQDSLNNIFLYFSDPKYLGDSSIMYGTIKMSYQIYLPFKFKLNKIYLDIQEPERQMFKHNKF